MRILYKELFQQETLVMFSDFVYGWLYYANDTSLMPAKRIILRFEVPMVKKLEKVIKVWGILDVMTILWYLGWSISKNQMPFVYDIKHQFLNAAPQIGMGTAISLSIIVFAAYMSLAISGYFLFRLKKAGVVIACIQSPLRVLTIIPPSVFFLLWPLSTIFDSPSAAIGFSLTLLVELIKISSMIAWWITLKKVKNVSAE